MADIYEILADDHRQAEELFVAIDDAELPERGPLLEQLRAELLRHAEAEKQVFYRRLAAHPDAAAVVGESLEDHAEIERMLDDLVAMDPASPDWLDMVHELQDSVQAHVAEEEDELFPLARDVLRAAEAERMVRAFRDSRRRVAVRS